MTAKCLLITTVYNEEKSIVSFLESIYRQTRRPDEVVIVDAESKDATQSIIQRFIKDHPQFAVKLFIKKGNRSVGRNEAIRRSSHELIAATDAGCILDPRWLEHIIQPFEKNYTIDVVGGWYQPIIKIPWHASLSKVLNFKAEKIDSKNFLPSSRSIAFKKNAWKKAGMYPEHLLTAEDTLFDLNLKKTGALFYFEPEAIAYWNLVNNYKSLYRMIRQYAYGDGEAKLFLSQYKIIFVYWSTTLFLVFLGFVFPVLFAIAFIFFISYLYVPIIQSRNVKNIMEIWQIPLIKLTVISANTVGYIKGIAHSKSL